MLLFLIVITGKKLLLFSMKQSHNVTLERQVKKAGLPIVTRTSKQEAWQFLSGLGSLGFGASDFPWVTMGTFQIPGGWCSVEYVKTEVCVESLLTPFNTSSR